MYRNSIIFAAPGAPAASEHEVYQRFSDGEDPVRVCPVPGVFGRDFEDGVSLKKVVGIPYPFDDASFGSESPAGSAADTGVAGIPGSICCRIK
jgi:hypothetical protein